MSISKPVRKLVAVGDVHGQFEAFVRLLLHAKLIDEDLNWCGGNTRFIQVGDIVDRGPFSRKVDTLLDNLQKQASMSEGEVIRLVGNHELELILADYLISEFKREEAAAMREKLIAQVEEGSLKAAYAYKDFLFTHAGVTRRLFKIFELQLEKISAANLAVLINLIFKESIANEFFKHPIFNISVRRKGPDRFGGIFWEDLEDLIASFQPCQGSPVWQVIGHTPIDNIVIDRALKLIPLDVGMHRKLQYLEVDDRGIPKVVKVPDASNEEFAQ